MTECSTDGRERAFPTWVDSRWPLETPVGPAHRLEAMPQSIRRRRPTRPQEMRPSPTHAAGKTGLSDQVNNTPNTSWRAGMLRRRQRRGKSCNSFDIYVNIQKTENSIFESKFSEIWSCGRKRRKLNGSGMAQSLLRHNAVASTLPSTEMEIMKLLAQFVGCSMSPCFLMKMLCKLKLLKLPIYPQSV